MRKRGSIPAARVFTCIGLSLCPALAGCASTSAQDAADRHLAAEFRRISPAEPMLDSADPAQLSLLQVDLLSFAPDADLSAARRLLHAGGLDAAELDLWQRNDLFAGTLLRSDLPLWRMHLPPFAAGLRHQFIAGQPPIPITAGSPQILQSESMRLVHPGGIEEVLSLSQGRMQLLLRLRKVSPGQFLLECTPQHQQSQMNWEKPQLSNELAILGREFSSHRLLTALRPDMLLVIGIDQLLPAPPSSANESGTPQPPIDLLAPPAPPRPPSLGQHLLLSTLRGNPSPTLLVISVADLPLPAQRPIPARE